MKKALEELNLSTESFFRDFRIGPPLFEAAKKSLPDADDSVIDLFIQNFRAKYDQIDYPLTTIYQGMEDLLFLAKKNDLDLYIATNKRDLPTRRLLDHFRWTDLFNGIYAVDSFEYDEKGKKGILARALADLKCRPDESIMIGDTVSDIQAGKDLGLLTIAFDRGYGNPVDLQNAKPSIQTSDANEIVRFLQLQNL